MTSTNTTPFPTARVSFSGDYSGQEPETPLYLNDFTRVLAREIRILLNEVEKLREEKQSLQQEILTMRGALNPQLAVSPSVIPEWRNQVRQSSMPAPVEPNGWYSPPPPTGLTTSRFRWRKLTLRPSKKKLAPAPKLPDMAPIMAQASPSTGTEPGDHRYHYHRRSMSPISSTFGTPNLLAGGSTYDGGSLPRFSTKPTTPPY